MEEKTLKQLEKEMEEIYGRKNSNDNSEFISGFALGMMVGIFLSLALIILEFNMMGF